MLSQSSVPKEFLSSFSPNSASLRTGGILLAQSALSPSLRDPMKPNSLPTIGIGIKLISTIISLYLITKGRLKYMSISCIIFVGFAVAFGDLLLAVLTSSFE